MITVSLLEPNWKELFETELAKIGLKKCAVNTKTKTTFKHGSRRFVFTSDYSAVDISKIKPALNKTNSEITFDEELFQNYIYESNLKKNKKRENENAIKFAQEFFQIRLVGMLQDIHSSISETITVEHSRNWMKVNFQLFRKEFYLEHKTNKTISDIVELDYLKEQWTLRAYSNVTIPNNPWYSVFHLFNYESSLENILQLLSDESIKELAEENLQKISSLDDKIKENDRTIQLYKSENDKYTLDCSKLDLEIAMKMKELYETFRHRPSENKSRKSIPTGEEGIPKT